MTVRPRPASPGLPTNVETDHPHEGLTPTLFTCHWLLRDRAASTSQYAVQRRPAQTDSRGGAPQRVREGLGDTGGTPGVTGGVGRVVGVGDVDGAGAVAVGVDVGVDRHSGRRRDCGARTSGDGTRQCGARPGGVGTGSAHEGEAATPGRWSGALTCPCRRSPQGYPRRSGPSSRSRRGRTARPRTATSCRSARCRSRGCPRRGARGRPPPRTPCPRRQRPGAR